MDSALWVAKTGLQAHHRRLEVISNNLANSATTAFKKNRPEFEDLAYQVIKQPGVPTVDQINAPTGIIVGTGVKIATNKKMFTEGNPLPTNQTFDLAIRGRGFLTVEIPNQTEMSYTRNGALEVNELGQLVTGAGYVIQPVITIPPGSQNITIAEDGKVTVNNPAGGLEEIGIIQLADFINPAGLFPMGDNLYKETVASGNPVIGNPTVDGLGKLHQGMLESSNVDIVEEMISMIEAQRTFEVTSKVVSAVDNMLQYLNGNT